jgi:regulation of enolase protein 1 (concanavalin A-like superfamily)
MSAFKFANSDQRAPEELATEFSISAPPSTDIWVKPPDTKRFNAPILYQTLPLSSFSKARVSVSANWKEQYDQGGLILVVKQQDGDTHWVKTGLEFYDGRPMAGTVAASDRGADWSLLPVPGGGQSVTVEMVNEQGSLWIFVLEGVRRLPVREVTWVLADAKDKECWVGVYAAKPDSAGGELDVTFAHLVIERS